MKFIKTSYLASIKKVGFGLLLALNINPNVKAEGGGDNSLSLSNEIRASGIVYKVVDGDTLIVNFPASDFAKFAKYNGPKTSGSINEKYKSVRIRIANIDTPESVHPLPELNTKRGKEASDFLRSWAAKKPANVRCFDIGTRNRFICNAIIDDRWDVGYEQIAAGYSKYITDFGKNPYFDKEYSEAFRKQ